MNGEFHDRIERDFAYHAPSAMQVQTMQEIRTRARELAHLIDASVPRSREKGSALTRLEECVMHANAGIVRSNT